MAERVDRGHRLGRSGRHAVEAPGRARRCGGPASSSRRSSGGTGGSSLLLLLVPPVAAFLFVYVGSLGALFVSAFWQVDSFTGKIVHDWTLQNFDDILHSGGTYLRIAGRTIGIAAAVTLMDAILAFPLAYYMARVASRGTRPSAGRRSAPALVELPRPDLRVADDPRPRRRAQLDAEQGRDRRRRPAVHELGDVARLHLHLAPVHGHPGLRGARAHPGQLPRGLGRPRRTRLAHVPERLLPLALPGIVAGSIFTFSLTLGDFITPLLIGGGKNNFIGNVVENFIGVNSNIPFAAAFAIVPVLIMAPT